MATGGGHSCSSSARCLACSLDKVTQTLQACGQSGARQWARLPCLHFLLLPAPPAPPDLTSSQQPLPASTTLPQPPACRSPRQPPPAPTGHPLAEAGPRLVPPYTTTCRDRLLSLRPSASPTEDPTPTLQAATPGTETEGGDFWQCHRVTWAEEGALQAAWQKVQS